MRVIESQVSVFLAGILILLVVTADVDGSEHTTNQGIFTEQQAAAGKDIYDAACGSCHGRNLMNGTSSAMVGTVAALNMTGADYGVPHGRFR